MFRIIVFLVLFLVAFGAVVPPPAAMADQTTFTWNGSQNNDVWENVDNWDANPTPSTPRWPGEESQGENPILDDIVIVEWIATNLNDRWPVKGAGDIIIAELHVRNVPQHPASATLPGSSSENHVIYVTDRDGLTVETGCTLTIGGGGTYPNAEVQLYGGGNIALGGTLEFAGAGSQLELSGIDNTYVTSGNGAIVGDAAGWITAPDTTVLVLGPDNGIYGDVTITAPLVNHGIVDTDGGTINLWCEPKIGPGLWVVDGGIMNVWAPVAGTGNLVVDGTLNVHRHFSLYGSLTQGVGAVIDVDTNIMFDVGVFAAEGCPVAEEE